MGLVIAQGWRLRSFIGWCHGSASARTILRSLLRRPFPLPWGALALLWLAGFLGLEGWPSLVALVISGFGITLELTLIMALPPCLERGEAVASLTAGMSFVGYSMAFVMPMIGG